MLFQLEIFALRIPLSLFFEAQKLLRNRRLRIKKKKSGETTSIEKFERNLPHLINHSRQFFTKESLRVKLLALQTSNSKLSIPFTLHPRDKNWERDLSSNKLSRSAPIHAQENTKQTSRTRGYNPPPPRPCSDPPFVQRRGNTFSNRSPARWYERIKIQQEISSSLWNKEGGRNRVAVEWDEKRCSERCKNRRSSWTVSFWFALQFKEGFFLSIQDAESSWEHDSKRWRAFSPCPRLCPRRLCHGPGACNWNPRLECRQDPLFAPLLAPPPHARWIREKLHRYSRVSRVRIFLVDLDYFLASFRDKVEIEDVELR